MRWAVEFGYLLNTYDGIRYLAALYRTRTLEIPKKWVSASLYSACLFGKCEHAPNQHPFYGKCNRNRWHFVLNAFQLEQALVPRPRFFSLVTLKRKRDDGYDLHKPLEGQLQRYKMRRINENSECLKANRIKYATPEEDLFLHISYDTDDVEMVDCIVID